MSDIAILAVAVAFGATGVLALVRPRVIPAQFGTDAPTPESRNEVGAVYGGFGLAVAALLSVAALGEPGTAEGIVVAVAFGVLGMAGGRLVSAARERPGGLYPVWVFFAGELVMAALLLAAVW